MTDPAFPTRPPADARPAPGSTGKLDRLKALLREMFQLARGDPDFGPHRIMNPKTAEVAALLDRDLPPQVKTKLNLTSTEEPARLEKEQEETRWKAWEIGVDPDRAPRPSSSSCNLPPVALDLYSRLQSAASAGAAGGPPEEKEREKAEADAEPDRFSLATHAPLPRRGPHPRTAAPPQAAAGSAQPGHRASHGGAASWERRLVRAPPAAGAAEPRRVPAASAATRTSSCG